MMEFGASISASASSSGAPASSPASRPPRKRRRPAVVCAECRRRKIACDRKSPCGQCALHNVDCVYVTGAVPPPYGHPVKAPTSPVLQPGAAPDWPDTDVPDVKPGTESLDPVSFGEDASVREPGRSASSTAEQLSRFGGRLAKTRLFGRTHWMHSMDQYTDIHALTMEGPHAVVPTLHKSLHTCKRFAQVIKEDYRSRVAAAKAGDPGWFRRPPRDVCDHLVALYFNAFECVFRVLHIPTFEKEYRQYWEDDAEADAEPDLFTAKLVLVLAMGSCFYDGYASLRDDLSLAVARAVQHFGLATCTPLDKRDLSLDRLQVHCLVLIARQTTAFDRGDDLIWFSTGSLQHMAFGMGLHRDPSNFRSFSVFDCEMRRRLWATVLELLVQSALDQGMPPLISTDDYDCRPPTNLDDVDIEDSPSEDSSSSDDSATQVHSNPYDGRLRERSSSSMRLGRPDTEFTQSSMQRLLLRSLPCRLKITKLMNSLNAVLPYGRVLQLSRELLEARRYTATTLRAAPLMMEGAMIDDREKDSFVRLRVLFYEVLTGRFHHSLHSPFARKSSGNTYHFSRRARIDTAVRLLCMSLSPAMGGKRSNSSGAPQDEDSRPQRQQPRERGAGKAVDDPCMQLFVIGRGLVKCTFIDVHATVVIELILQLQEDFIPGADLSVTQRELYGTAQACQTLLEDRILAGETSVKGLFFFAGGMAQLEALMSGRPVQRDIADAMDRAAEQGIGLLQDLASFQEVTLTLPDDTADAPVDIAVAAPVDTPADASVAASVATSVATSVDALVPDMPPMVLPQENMLNMIVAPTSNIAGSVLYSEIGAGIVDIDATAHFPTDFSVTDSACSWGGAYYNPNWFYPDNDYVGASF